MSLLLSQGQPSARRYPLWMLWDEARIVQERHNGFAVTQAVLTQLAVASLFSKEAGQQFAKLTKRLSDGD